MNIEAAVLNIVLYTVWVGVPIILLALVLLGVGNPNNGAGEELGIDEPSAAGGVFSLRTFLPVVLIAATITILIDVLVLPGLAFRRLVYAWPWGTDFVRVILFPLSLFVGRGIALAAAMIKPREVDARFQSDLRGTSHLWAALAFLAAVVALCSKGYWNFDLGTNSAAPASRYQTENLNTIDSGNTGNSGNSGKSNTGINQEAAELPAEKPPAQDLFSGANYELFNQLILDAAVKHDLSPQLLLALVAEESNFDPNYRGPGGGNGLLNVTANMARQVGVADYVSPSLNLDAGALVLKSLIKLFGANNPRLAIAAYHFGTQLIKDSPQLVNEPGEIKLFVDAVMRKVADGG